MTKATAVTTRAMAPLGLPPQIALMAQMAQGGTSAGHHTDRWAWDLHRVNAEALAGHTPRPDAAATRLPHRVLP